MCSLFDRFKIFPSSPSLTIRTCSMHDSSGRSLSYTCVQYMIQTFWLCFYFYTCVSDMIQTLWLCFNFYTCSSDMIQTFWLCFNFYNCGSDMIQTFWLCFNFYTCVSDMIQTFWLCFNFYTRVSDMIQTFWLCFILVFQKWSRRSGCLILVFHTVPIALYLCSKHASAVQTMLYIRAPYIIQPFWLFLYLFVAFCTNADVYFRGVLSVTIIWSKSDI